ncbi:MAG: hypothetical protein AAF715_03775 [Myxococcota bacterium]
MWPRRHSARPLSGAYGSEHCGRAPTTQRRRRALLWVAVGAACSGGNGGCGGERADAGVGTSASATPSASTDNEALSTVLSADASVVVAVGAQKYAPGKVTVVRRDDAVVVLDPAPVGPSSPTSAPPSPAPPAAERTAAGEAIFVRGERAPVGLCLINPALERAPGGPESWFPCRERGDAVEDGWGNRHRNLELTKRARAIAAATETKLASFLERRAAGRAFDDAFAAAGAPRAPKGFVPRVDQRVLAHFVDTSWYEADVVAVMPRADRVRVAWRGGHWDDRNVSLTAVVPLPDPGAPPVVAAGQWALARAEPGRRWTPVRVRDINGENVDVADRLGSERRVRRSDLVLLVAPMASETVAPP